MAVAEAKRDLGGSRRLLRKQQSPKLRAVHQGQFRSDRVEHVSGVPSPSAGHTELRSFPSRWREDETYRPLDGDSSLGHEGIYGRDALHLYTHYFEINPASENLIPEFLLEVATNGTENPGVAGMGLSSTLLQGLFNRALVAGRTFSLYVGSGMDRAGGVINGSIAFGGYDSGRFIGTVHNYSMDISHPHPLAVQVKDIIISDPAAPTKNVSLFDPSQFPDMKRRPDAFEAKITTDQYPMSFPAELTRNYMSYLGAEESDNADGSLRLTRPFNGTMSVVLSDGFTVTIPSNVMYNVSGISPVAASEEDSDEPFYLSLAWLSQVYLMVDYEAYKFHLAQALAEAPFVTPETFCPKTVPQPYFHKTKNNFEATGMIGAVIGGVFGGLGLIALLVALFVFWRRRRAEKSEEQMEDELAMAKMAQFEVEISSGGSLKKGPSKSKWSLSNLRR